MGKRLGALGAVIAVVALAVGIALPAAGSTGHAAHHRTIRVTAVVTELKVLDLGGTGFSLGNEIVFSEKLLQGANQLGHAGAVCTEVSVARQEAQCIATYSFPGIYEGAKGELHVQTLSPTEGILTFHLEH
jgi:hypothetical protein